MKKLVTFTSLVCLGAAALVALNFSALEARSRFSFGFNLGFFSPAPAPIVVAPSPVYVVAPPPVVMTAPPVVVNTYPVYVNDGYCGVYRSGSNHTYCNPVVVIPAPAVVAPRAYMYPSRVPVVNYSAVGWQVRP